MKTNLKALIATTLFFGFNIVGFNANAQVLPRMPNGPQPSNSDIKSSPLKVPTVGELNNAVIAYQKGDFVDALKLASDLAQRGDANASALVGFLYEYGFGTEKSLPQAAKYYRQGALQNSNDAMMGLGRVWVGDHDLVNATEVDTAYQNAIKAGRDDAFLPYGDFLMAQGNAAKAVIQYERAALNGDTNAAYSLAILYDDGDDSVPDNPQKARNYLHSAAEGGIVPAQADYGLLLYQGRGGEKNSKSAAEWFKKAAEGGDKNGAFYWALVNAKGDGVAQNIPTAKKYAALAKADVPDAAKLYGQILQYEKLNATKAQTAKPKAKATSKTKK